MSFINCEITNQETEVPSWYSVICGQGTYDVRGFSADDAGNRVLHYIKSVNEQRSTVAEIYNKPEPSDEVRGLPLSTEYPIEEAFKKEIIWRRTGGDENDEESFVPLLVEYRTKNPYSLNKIENINTSTKDSEPNLLAYIGEIAFLSRDERVSFISGLIQMSPIKKDARISSVPL